MTASTRMRVTALAALVALAGAGCFVGQGNVFSLEVGQCFDDPNADDDQISDVVIVECASPHDNEVFAAFDLPGAIYPGSADVFAAAEAGCIEQFDDYVGLAYGTGGLGATFLAPTEQSWDNSDDREVICYLYDRSGARLVESMRGPQV